MSRSIATFGLLFLATSILAQSSAAAPKPGPEHKRMEYWLGTWTLQSDVKASPFGPAGKANGMLTAELGPGGFFIVFRTDMKMPAGNMNNVGVMGYDAQTKSYTFNGFNSMGAVVTAKGTIQGRTWTWTTEDRINGKLVKGRFTATEATPTSYTYKFELLTDSGGSSTVEEGKATKAR